jgi:hypothetical protein
MRLVVALALAPPISAAAVRVRDHDAGIGNSINARTRRGIAIGGRSRIASWAASRPLRFIFSCCCRRISKALAGDARAPTGDWVAANGDRYWLNLGGRIDSFGSVPLPVCTRSRPPHTVSAVAEAEAFVGSTDQAALRAAWTCSHDSISSSQKYRRPLTYIGRGNSSDGSDTHRLSVRSTTPRRSHSLRAGNLIRFCRSIVRSMPDVRHGDMRQSRAVVRVPKSSQIGSHLSIMMRAAWGYISANAFKGSRFARLRVFIAAANPEG